MTSDSRWTSPGELLAASGGYWESCAIHAGVELDLFNHLTDKALTATELAETAGCDPVACEQLLNALCALELMVFDGTTFSNSDYSQRFLCRKSPMYLGSIINHHRRLLETWSTLADVVRKGQAHGKNGHSDDGDLEDFLRGMANMGAINGPGVLELIDLTGRHRLLDIGSGPGAYAAQFCQHYPDLHATLFDRADTGPYVKEMIKCYGLEDRMTFVSGDFNADPVGKNFDVIWGSHILHSNATDEVTALIKKLYGALVPGGQLLIQEFILDDDKCGPPFPALFSLNMVLNTPGGRSYSQEELEEIMRDAGFTHLVRLEPPGPASIILAEKPN